MRGWHSGAGYGPYTRSGEEPLMRRRYSLTNHLRRRPAGPRSPSTALVSWLLRDAYAPPDDPAFWDRLESRIMAVAQPAPTWSGGGWPAAFRAWARAGLAAACAAAAAAGVAAWTSHATEARVAYETVLDRSAADPVLADTRFINVSEQEATARYVLSH
jgi:hypothetical protein